MTHKNQRSHLVPVIVTNKGWATNVDLSLLPEPSGTPGLRSFGLSWIQRLALITGSWQFWSHHLKARFVFLFCFVLHSENSNHSYNSKATHIFVSLPTFSFLTIKTKWIFCVKKKWHILQMITFIKGWHVFIRILAYLLYFFKTIYLLWLCWVFICACDFL